MSSYKYTKNYKKLAKLQKHAEKSLALIDNPQYDNITDLFSTPNPLLTECLLKAELENVAKPAFNPCIDYQSYCDTMQEKINKNLEVLKQICLMSNFFDKLDATERRNIKIYDKEAKLGLLKRSRSKKLSLDRHAECPF